MEYLDGLEMYIVKNIEGLEREDEWKEKMNGKRKDYFVESIRLGIHSFNCSRVCIGSMERQ